MENVNYLSVVEEVMQQIKSTGALLVVKSKVDRKINLMTKVVLLIILSKRPLVLRLIFLVMI
jgi:hypothetical protein